MKKLFFIFTCIVLASVIQVKASDAALFHIDESSVYDEFEGLTLLEDYVFFNEGITLNELVESKNPLVNTLQITSHSKDLLSTLGTSFEFDTASFLLGVGAGIVACGLGCFFSIYVFAYSY